MIDFTVHYQLFEKSQIDLKHENIKPDSLSFNTQYKDIIYLTQIIFSHSDLQIQ